MRTPPSHIIVDNRLHAVWEKSEALGLSLYDKNVGWFDSRPATAPSALRKLADDFLALACELDAIARDIAAEDKQSAESTLAAGKALAETIGEIERDGLTERLAEIVRRGAP
jgi:hypothetical protein